MLSVENLSKRYRAGNYGVRDVSLALESVAGLLGANGAGKTTLMQLIATITRPTEGRIVFDGVETPSPRGLMSHMSSVAEHSFAMRINSSMSNGFASRRQTRCRNSQLMRPGDAVVTTTRRRYFGRVSSR